MKKYCFLFVFIFCCFILQSNTLDTALAEQDAYCRVITDNVILYRLAVAVLHKRNVLMRGGVEYYVGAVVIEDRLKPCDVSDRAYLNAQIETSSVCAAKFLLNIVSVIFVNIKDNKSARLAFCNLSCKFATYRATTTGDKNGFILVELLCFRISNFKAISE